MTDKTLPTLTATTAPADDSIMLIRRNGQVEDEKVTGANLKSYFLNSATISGATIDNSVIGGTTPAAGSFTTLTANTIDTGQGAVECYAMDQAVRTSDSVSFSALSLTTDLAVTHGGTGASTASGARTNLGLVIGTNVQAQDAGLQSIADLTTAANKGIYTTASDTYATYDLSAGGRALSNAAGTANTFPYFSALNTVSLASITTAGLALLDDADASAQRTTLGLVIGTNVQAYDAGLQSIAGLTTAADRMIYTTALDTYAVTTLTSFGRSLIDDASASAARTTLGLGTIATQAASNVTITGGSISGITDLAVGDGGTGASTAGGARTNLGLGSIATQDSTNVSISGGSITGISDLAIADGGTGASTASAAFDNLKQAATTTSTGVVEKATAAEMAAETADKYPDASLVRYHPGVAKAWIDLDQTGTQTDDNSYNVASISDDGTGLTTVSWDTDFANTNYVCVGMTSAQSAGNDEGLVTLIPGSRAVGSAQFQCVDVNNAADNLDYDPVMIAAFGDQ